MEIIWVKGHAGHPENERCDCLAHNALENMSVEEIAEILASATLCLNFGECEGLRCGSKECQELHKQWLESEVENMNEKV